MGKPKSKQDLLIEAQLFYHDHPVEFFRDILRVELDEQQIEAVSLVRPGCRIAIKSSKGTGKTFIIAGLCLWFLTCHPDVNMRVLSPSYDQLIDVFQREVRQHHKRMLPEFAALVDVKFDKVELKDDPTNVAVLVSAQSTKRERQSGVHSFTQVYLIDEGSGVEDSTYSNAIGSLGTARAGDDGRGGYVIVVSNPERGSQPFYTSLFSKAPKGWDLLTFTAFRSKQTSAGFIEEIRELYGEDSDEWRVMVLGEFPRADGSMFIPASVVDEASQRIVTHQEVLPYPVILGVDVARSTTGDSSVIAVRQGAKLTDLYEFKLDDTMVLVGKIRDLFYASKAQVICIDADGVGGPVADRCRQLGLPIIEIRSSLPSSDPMQYANIRTQLWGEMREWLKSGSIPNNEDLKFELSTMTWGYDKRMAEQLTSKKKLVDNRGKRIKSPDRADALAYTFFASSLSSIRRKTKARPVRRTAWI
jgi:hypothetical protein